MDAWQQNTQRNFINPQHGRSVGIHILNLNVDYVNGKISRTLCDVKITI
ncbi:hypothetical protein bmyco0002_54830 [Bacillus pseudomycoides]|nr:hypothetical protein bmyco0002_54830 [Bacillus pseudomycoides]